MIEQYVKIIAKIEFKAMNRSCREEFTLDLMKIVQGNTDIIGKRTIYEWNPTTLFLVIFFLFLYYSIL